MAFFLVVLLCTHAFFFEFSQSFWGLLLFSLYFCQSWNLKRLLVLFRVGNHRVIFLIVQLFQQRYERSIFSHFLLSQCIQSKVFSIYKLFTWYHGLFFLWVFSFFSHFLGKRSLAYHHLLPFGYFFTTKLMKVFVIDFDMIVIVKKIYILNLELLLLLFESYR